MRLPLVAALLLMGALLAGCNETPVVTPPPPVPVYDPCITPCNIPMATETWNEYEPSIAINPTNPSNIIVGVHDDPFGQDGNCPLLPVLGLPPAMLPGCFLLSAYVSNDGGKSWNRSYLPHSGTADPDSLWSAWCNMGDPVLLFDDAGAVYYFGLGIACSDLTLTAVPVSSLFVTKSTDGGATWGEPVSIWTLPGTAQFQDKQWAAIDPATGRIAVSWSAFTGCTRECAFIDLYASISSDGGATWSDQPLVVTRAPVRPIPGVAEEEQVNYFSQPTWGENGTLHVAYRSCGGDCVRVSTSADEGRSWTPSLVMQVSDPGRTGNQSVFFSYPSIGTDYSSGPHGGRIYVTAGSMPTQDYDILLSWSDDDGKTWTAPIQLNDNPTGDGTDQFHHWMDVEGGLVHAIYFDRRHDPGNVNIQASWTAWDPATGKTTSRQLEAPWAPDPTGGDGAYYAHYITVDAIPGHVALTWDRAGMKEGEASIDSHVAVLAWPRPVALTATTGPAGAAPTPA